MSPELPPDLDRLGDQLFAATARDVDARRRRGSLLARARAVLALVTLAAVVAVVASSETDRQQRPGRLAAAPTATAGPRSSCDRPRSGTFSLRDPCGPPGGANRALAYRRPVPGVIQRRL